MNKKTHKYEENDQNDYIKADYGDKLGKKIKKNTDDNSNLFAKNTNQIVYEKNLSNDDDNDDQDSESSDEALQITFTSEDLHKLVHSLEKNLIKNQELRIKYHKQPEKFMDSEVDLDENIIRFNALTTLPELWPEFISSNAIPKLIQLIIHDNIDLSIDLLNLIKDFVEIEIDQNNLEICSKLFDEFLNNELIELLVQNLPRFNSERKEEFEAIHNSLSIIENIVEVKPKMAKEICDKTKILYWLIKKLESKTPFDDNKLYASEILSILTQNTKENQFTLGKMGGIEHLLLILAEYRKKDPELEEEREMIENIFDALCSTLLIRENQEIFRHSEGFELMIRMLKEKKFCARLALKAINFALSKSQLNCKYFIEILGLKYLFPIFMKKILKEKKAEQQMQIDEHVISSIQSLISNCQGVDLDRVFNKFMEDNCEKVDQLMEYYQKYKQKIQDIDDKLKQGYSINELESEDVQDTIFLEKLDNGYYILQNIVYIISKLLLIQDNYLKTKMSTLLKNHGIEKQELTNFLNEFGGHIEDSMEFKKQKDELIDLAKKITE